ncbi:MAG: DNA polymerase III subunit gamma/tau [Eubacteriales bacterium]|nr:DNA polymerase III subunit gamma/tau [Eubacteriales bacterium]
MYQALYRAYRPEVFEEVLGQEHIVKILKNQIATDSTSHAYLFCGTRGTGKTTVARLLAKGLNCLSEGSRPCGECANCKAIKEGNFIDVIEIDAASNNGVDNIRELRESVNYPPAAGRKKIYIIDEVHMLSGGAFNALLKTLEEPPEYVTFILATTEIHKLPATILSRCMRLDFKRVPENILISGMKDICSKIGIEVSESALRIIASNADGSVRDGLSILDQCISGGEKTVGEKDVLEFLGASGDEDFLELTDLIRKKKTSEAIAFLAGVLSDGKDVRQFNRDWINHFRNLLMVKFMKNPETVVNMSPENIERIRRQAEKLDLEDINLGILELSKTLDQARWSTQPRILLELAIVKLSLDAKEIQKPRTHFGSVPETGEGTTAPAAKSKALPLPVVKPEAAPSPIWKPEGTTAPVAKSKAPPSSTSNPELTARPKGSDAAVEDFDCERIWNDVFEDGEATKGSFYIIRSCGRLRSIDENDFTVVVESDLAKQHAENNRNLLEDLMEKHTGKRRMMKISGNNQKDNRKKTAGEIAEKVSDILGIEVEVE